MTKARDIATNEVVTDEIGSTIQAYDADLNAIAALDKTDGNVIVGDGTNWVAESGATARTSLGLGTAATTAATDYATAAQGALADSALQSIAANSVGSTEIASNAVGADELNVTGNGTTSQFLRSDGDGSFTWGTPTSPAPTTAQVLSATAGASVGAVGTYAWLGYNNTGNTTISEGQTIAGSVLRYGGLGIIGWNLSQYAHATSRGGTPAGTWRVMGKCQSQYGDVYPSTIFLRIS